MTSTQAPILINKPLVASFGIRQTGTSLISVLTGLLISSIFIGGLLQMYSNYVGSERFHEAQSALHDNGRFTVSDLKRIIVSAGLDLTQEDITNGITALSPVVDAAGGNDSLVVSYKRDGGCSKEISTTATSTVTNVTIWINSKSDLLCKHASQGQAITNDVKSLQILYGVDTDNDNHPNYYTPSRLLAASDLTKIRTIRIGLLVSSSDFQMAAADASRQERTYQVLDEIIPIPAGDQRMYRVYETTIYLRNMSTWITGS